MAYAESHVRFSQLLQPNISSFASIQGWDEPHVDYFSQEGFKICPSWASYQIVLHRDYWSSEREFEFDFNLPQGLSIESVEEDYGLDSLNQNGSAISGSISSSFLYASITVNIDDASADINDYVSISGINSYVSKHIYLRKDCSAANATISGTVYEDYNYSGGLSTYDSSMYELDDVQVDLIEENLGIVESKKTDRHGFYEFTNVKEGRYYVRANNIDSIPSYRDNHRTQCSDNRCKAVMVSPWVSKVHQTAWFDVTGSTVINLGVNYNAVINTEDDGAGSLRQVLQNLSYLSNDGWLDQTCKYCEDGKDNVIFALNTVPQRVITLSSPLNTSPNVSGQNETYIDARDLNITIQNDDDGHSSDDYGFHVIRSSDTRISGFEINGFYNGILIEDCSDSDCDIEISHNTITDSYHSAIVLDDADDNDIYENVIDNAFKASSDHNNAAAILLQGTGDCTAHDSDDCDSRKNGSSDNDIERNTIKNTAKGNTNLAFLETYPPSGIRVYQGWENEFTENTYLNNIGISIDLMTGTLFGVVEPNDGEYRNDHPHDGIDHPIITDYVINGDVLSVEGFIGKDEPSNAFDDFEIELYKAATNLLGQTQGEYFLGECDEDNDLTQDFDNGRFACRIDISDSDFEHGDALTAITIDDEDNTSEFGSAYWGPAEYDYGDAPNEDLGTGWETTIFPVLQLDNGARHGVVDGVALVPESWTSTVFHNSAESDGQPSRYADADTSDDGVEFNSSNSEVGQSSLPVLVTGYIDAQGSEQNFDNEILIRASADGYVSVWLDRNQDGSWSDFERNQASVSEKVIDRAYVSAGENRFTVNLSAYDVHGESWVRVRYSTLAGAIYQPTGQAPDGEVEDYRVWIAAPSMGIAGCEAGLQNGSFEHFYIEENHNGWDTPESSVAGWSIVQQDPSLNPHSEPYGQRRNHIEFNRYDQYVYDPSSDSSENVAEMNVYHPTVMYQDIVTKPGDKIRWSFDYSNRTYPDSVEDDQISLMFGSPDEDLVEEALINGTDSWQNHTGVYQVPEGQRVTRIAFRGNKPASSSAGNILDNAKFGCEVGVDFGDLPASYNQQTSTSRIVSPDLYIGNEPADTETEHLASDLAKGDDIDGFNDELTFDSPVIVMKGETISISGIPVMNSTGASVQMMGYLDVLQPNASVFSRSEESAVLVVPHSESIQSATLTWTFTSNELKQWTTDNQVYLRLVLGGSDTGIGEVEDHLVYNLDKEMPPSPGRCDGFIQVKEPQGSNAYQYAKWKAKGGQIDIEVINANLDVDNLKAVGVNQADGLTYGVGTGDGTEHKLYIATQENNAEFTELAELRAVADGVFIRSKDGEQFTFTQGEALNSDKRRDGISNKKLGKANSGDVSPDGKFMIIGRSAWHSLVRVDLLTGAFDTIQLTLPNGEGTPWSADFAFDLSGADQFVYGLSRGLDKLYKISIVDGTFTEIALTLKLSSEVDETHPEWPREDDKGKLASGGFGINKGGVLFAMTNGGIHDLNQDGVISDSEDFATTALYSIDINRAEIRFEMQGKESQTSSNDAGGCAIHADFGDVPLLLEGNNPAQHVGTNLSLKLGDSWSADLGPGDDSEADADFSDDGVRLENGLGEIIDLKQQLLIPGHAYRIVVTSHGAGIASKWVSWDGSTWSKLPGNILTIPQKVERGYLRVRYSSVALGSPYGEAIDGEVEDYALNIGNEVKAITVYAPTAPLTCEVAEYVVTLDVEGGKLSHDVDVEVSFDKAPLQCWFDGKSFDRTELSDTARCDSETRKITFESGGDLSRTIWVATDSELSPITLVAKEPDLGEAIGAAMFEKEGFTISPVNPPEYYKAGQEFTLEVERKIALESTRCSVDPDYDGVQEFEFNYDQGAEHYKGELFIGGQRITSDTPVSVRFESGVSESITANYFESGFLNISAKYLPEQGREKTAGLATPIHFKPYGLVIDSVYLEQDSNVIDDGDIDTYFVPAESEFTVDVLAVAKGHSYAEPKVTRNFNAALTDVAGYSATVFTPTAKQGTNASDFSSTSALYQFNDGKLSTNYQYENVGSIEARWEVDTYVNSNLSGFLNTDTSEKNGGRSGVIGHFYPDAFKVNSSGFSTGVTKAGSAEEWTYYGQPNVDLNLALDAIGVGGNQLSFYDSNLWLGTDFATLDDLVTLSQGICNDGKFSANGKNVGIVGDACDFESSWLSGVLNISVNGAQFVRDNNELGRTALTDVQASLIDQEFRYVEAESPDTYISESLDFGELVDVRYGRLVLNNVSGPTEQYLPMRIQAQYWAQNEFEVNDWHSESSLSAFGTFETLENLKPVANNPDNTIPAIGDDSLTVSNVSLGQSTTSISGSAAGYVEVPFGFTGGVANWLGYCWKVDVDSSSGLPSKCGSESSYQQPPSAIATFGTSKGSDNIIYIMERFN
ncbi:right-handed parallel beta-helix repeat-containing protein [Vibrio sp. T187]|uniref:DUF6701 domain-containing protein n=1 Tax=Vibrio TaxID=662 RepID=UPI0010C965ED|nr:MULTISPECIES: DUF6701 domain-containing protein [Vibrio]MBW3696516.1 right-handed parallel beta-helix repeat-containing protein [Vibrio sp. T187]